MAKGKKLEIVVTEETKKHLKEKGYAVSENKNLEELIEKEMKKLKYVREKVSKRLEKKMTTNISWLQNVHEAEYYYKELKDLAKELHDTIREVYSCDDIVKTIAEIDKMFREKPCGVLFEMYIGTLLIMRAIKIFYPKVEPRITINSIDEDSEKIKEIKIDLKRAIEEGDMELVEYIIEELKSIVGDFRDKRHNTIKELMTSMIKAKQKKLDSF